MGLERPWIGHQIPISTLNQPRQETERKPSRHIGKDRICKSSQQYSLQQNISKYLTQTPKIRIYDLRYLATPDPTKGTPPRMLFPTFTEYCYNPLHGFDVHDNLIATATRDSQFQIFDAGSGKELKLDAGTSLPEQAHSISCLKFAEAPNGGGMRLYGSAENVMHEWGWFDGEKECVANEE